MKYIFTRIMLLLISTMIICASILTPIKVYATNNLVVTLDAGHGGYDGGAQSPDGKYIEKVWNLQTTEACKKVLEQYGIDVIMTRKDDTFVSLSERKRIGKDSDACVSIHYNASQDKKGSYGLVIGGKKEGSTKLAKAIQEQLLKVRDNVIIWENNNKYSMTNVDAPCVIVESAFIDSKDTSYADTLEERQEIGEHIAYGILNYLGIDIKEEAVNNFNKDTIENKSKESDVENRIVNIKENKNSKNLSFIDKIKSLFSKENKSNKTINHIKDSILND